MAIVDEHSSVLDASLRPSRELSGLFALESIARSLGIHTTAGRIARANGIGQRPVGTSDIARCADGLGLKALVLNLSWTDIARLGSPGLPAILMLKTGDALVLRALLEDHEQPRVIVEDPSAGDARLVLDRARLEDVWDGTVIRFIRKLNLKDTTQPFGNAFFAAIIFRERRLLRDLALCALMLSFLALIPILFWRLLQERVLVQHSMSSFVAICTGAGLLFAVDTAIGGLRRFLALRLTTRIEARVVTYIFDKVLALPVTYFETNPAGLTLYKMSQFSHIKTFLTNQLFGTVLDFGVLFFFLPVMLFFDPLLTVIVLTFGLAICAWVVVLLPAYRRRSSDVEQAEAERGTFLFQSIRGMRTVKSLALEPRQRATWDRQTADIARKRASLEAIRNIIQSGVVPLQNLMTSGALGIGVYLAMISDSTVAVSTLFAFLMLSQRVASPLVQMTQLIQQYDEARAAVNVVASLVNLPPETTSTETGFEGLMKGHIRFTEVTFKYAGAPRPALHKLSFEVLPGTTLGIMGRSGSGKTTITRLLQRLHAEFGGALEIDGIDIRDWDLAHLRSNMGVVLQENFLFKGTIRDNIVMAKPDATFDEMVHAARLAGAEEFIDKLARGYDTEIYEGSSNLSGGQRQRLAIARALITDPRLLILDEATSALDAESEAIVNANIERMSAGRTVITISHRLSSLVKADAIMVLDKGEINDIGRHAELLERNDIYAALWHTQNEHATTPASTTPPFLSLVPKHKE